MFSCNLPNSKNLCLPNIKYLWFLVSYGLGRYKSVFPEFKNAAESPDAGFDHQFMVIDPRLSRMHKRHGSHPWYHDLKNLPVCCFLRNWVKYAYLHICWWAGVNFSQVISQRFPKPLLAQRISKRLTDGGTDAKSSELKNARKKTHTCCKKLD